VGKFVRRTRRGLALAAAPLVAIAVAGVLSVEQAREANLAAARASEVKDFVLATFRLDGPGASGPAPRELLLEHGARLIDARFDAQPALQAELHGVVSGLFDELARFEMAERHAVRRLQVLTGSGAPAAEQAAAALSVSRAQLRLGRAEPAEALASQALAGSEPGSRLAVAARLQRVAALAAQAKVPALAEELDRLDAELGGAGVSPTIEHALALSGRAALASLSGQAERSVALASQAVAQATAIEGAASPHVLNLRWNLWRMLIGLRRVAPARDLGSAIIADLRLLGGPRDPTAAFAEIYATAFEFANDPEHRLSFDAAEALILANRGIVQARGCRGIADAAAWSDYFLGWLYASWHDFERAEPLLSRATERIVSAGEQAMLIPYAPRLAAWTWIVRGEHARGDAVLRRQLDLMQRQHSPFAERTQAGLAFSIGMQGRVVEALGLLGPAPAMPGGIDGADPRALEIGLIRAALLADNGQAALALSGLPSTQSLRSLAGADGGLRGAALCASGRAAEGLEALDAYLAAESPRRSPASPFIARTRAIQGACALSLGDVHRALSAARLSRQAFQQQSTVSAYFKQPLERLEGALARPTSVASVQP
ncbi:MAG: hypothetical protein IV094_09570, partial [Vitreoscilla sp.]|nr:hypothetical protein [Vitreoscilla sp.]